MTIANKITLLRICLIPVFIVAYFAFRDGPLVAIPTAVFAVASFTDFLDGYLARSRNEVTTFGKFMDPIADKLLVMSAFVMLVEQQRMPGWVCILMLAREFIVSGFRLVASGKGKVIAAGIWGKLKTITQMIYVPMALLLIPIKALDPAVHPIWQVLTDIMMYISLALTLWSGFCYIWNNREYIKDM